MLELRWYDNGEFLELQFRVLENTYMDAAGALSVAQATWSEWRAVPTVRPS